MANIKSRFLELKEYKSENRQYLLKRNKMDGCYSQAKHSTTTVDYSIITAFDIVSSQSKNSKVLKCLFIEWNFSVYFLNGLKHPTSYCN